MELIAPDIYKVSYDSDIRLGLKVQGPTEVVPNLFLAGAGASDKELVEFGKRKVDAVVSMGCEYVVWFLKTFCKNAAVLKYDFEDSVVTCIVDELDNIADFIHGHLSAGRCTVVFCRAGMSRSAAAVAFYLTKYHNMTLSDALIHIMQRRCIYINDGFCFQLYAKTTCLSLARTQHAGEFLYGRHGNAKNPTRDMPLYATLAAAMAKHDYWDILETEVYLIPVTSVSILFAAHRELFEVVGGSKSQHLKQIIDRGIDGFVPKINTTTTNSVAMMQTSNVLAHGKLDVVANLVNSATANRTANRTANGIANGNATSIVEHELNKCPNKELARKVATMLLTHISDQETLSNKTVCLCGQRLARFIRDVSDDILNDRCWESLGNRLDDCKKKKPKAMLNRLMDDLRAQ